MVYEAILFDMDGVIIDTRASITTFWQELAAAHQVQLAPADFNQHVYGCLPGHTLDQFFPQLDAQTRAAIIEQNVAYETKLAYHEIPGAMSFLRRLRRFGIPTALVTSCGEQKIAEVSRQLELDGLFTERVLSSDIQRGKPYPDAYLLAAKKLHRPPEVCIVFEDAISGVRAAVTASTHCIGVQTPDMAPALLEAGASSVVPNLDAIQIVPANNETARWILQVGDAEKLSLGPC